MPLLVFDLILEIKHQKGWWELLVLAVLKKPYTLKPYQNLHQWKESFKIEALEAVTFTRTEECIEILAMQLCQMWLIWMISLKQILKHLNAW